MPNGDYKWKVSYIPRYDSYYGQYQIGWKVKELYFTHTIVPPIFDPANPFIQNPDPICQGSQGNVSVNLSQGSNGATYIWDDEGSLTNGAYIQTFGPQYNYCKVVYPSSSAYPKILGPTYHVKCTVSNSAGSVVGVKNLYFDDNCSSCPTLAFKIDGDLIDENPLLITSLSNPEIDVTDFYLINTPITPEEGEINFTIHEPQTEHTWLDYVELIEVKVKDKEYIVVTNDGEFVNYRKPLIPFMIP